MKPEGAHDKADTRFLLPIQSWAELLSGSQAILPLPLLIPTPCLSDHVSTLAGPQNLLVQVTGGFRGLQTQWSLTLSAVSDAASQKHLLSCLAFWMAHSFSLFSPSLCSFHC